MDNYENKIEVINSNVNEDLEEEKINADIETENKKENFATRLKSKKGLLGILGIFLLAILKFKAIIFLVLGKLKFLLVLLKLGKFASTIGSMLFMIVIYAQMYGWIFGIGFVILLLVHEMGHYMVAKSIKLDVSLPIFIPFVGAAIRMKEEPKDAVIEAKMAIGGPLVGSLGALVCLLLGFLLKKDVLIALAYTGFMLNLFNLIPLHPLDGGRIVSAISPKLWLIGIPIGIIALFKAFNPIIVLLLILGVIKVIEQYRNPNKYYYKVKTSTRWIFALNYFGLMLLLGLGITYVHGIHLNMIA
ncbi:peptidase family M50 [Clostridium puniceum]|uniref:Peptidase family M50 n=1 Tax=Clostridium puniceum TaxID=29367 RepID=A0A1S8TNC9_9CLOT|nr:site-2 protease family protein [Clostridium puniceum]OOM79283.1 peptidase family M50 [Clostridium puniceum]